MNVLAFGNNGERDLIVLCEIQQSLLRVPKLEQFGVGNLKRSRIDPKNCPRFQLMGSQVISQVFDGLSAIRSGTRARKRYKGNAAEEIATCSLNVF
jgi:hypothetical protein